MYENQQHEIILRELKTKFPQKKFEHFLDQLIEEKLVLRENRRYMLNFPIFNNEKDLTESQNITNELLPQLRELSQEEQKLAMGKRFGVIVLKVKKIIFMEQLRIFFLSTK